MCTCLVRAASSCSCATEILACLDAPRHDLTCAAGETSIAAIRLALTSLNVPSLRCSATLRADEIGRVSSSNLSVSYLLARERAYFDTLVFLRGRPLLRSAPRPLVVFQSRRIAAGAHGRDTIFDLRLSFIPFFFLILRCLSRPYMCACAENTNK